MPIFTMTIFGNISARLMIGLCNISSVVNNLPLNLPFPTLFQEDQDIDEKNSLPTLPTETSLHTLPTPRRIILVPFHNALFIGDFDLFLLNRQIAGYIRASNFAAVGAVAQMASGAGEELRVVDCYADGAAETGGC